MKIIRKNILRILFFFTLIIPTEFIFSQPLSVPFESEQWQMINAEIVEIDGKSALMGMAILKDVQFENGTIEVNIYTTGERSYPGVIFRLQDMQNYERFYIRPHRNGLYGDDLQYTPVFNGIAGWQLYHGEGYTANKDWPDGQWTHLRIDIADKQALIYCNYDSLPALVIKDLKHGLSKGSIGIFGPRDQSAYFADFAYQLSERSDKSEAKIDNIPYGMIKNWKISQPFKASTINLEIYPPEQVRQTINWQDVHTERSGLLDIARYFGRTSRAGDCIFARTEINADTAHVFNFKFGYSDAVSIFLNGRLIFFGNSAYRFRDPSFLGIIGLHDAVYLPLNRGVNEIMLIVWESFGGWGFMGQDGDAVYQHTSVDKRWDLHNQLRMPESVVFDSKRNRLYVSNYFNDDQEFISILNLNGEILNLEWIIGLNRPTGLTLYEDVLYAIDRNALLEIDIDSSKIRNRFSVPDRVFINDIAVDDQGTIYISDNDGHKIHRFQNGQFDVWLEGGAIIRPNGLCIDGNHLLVGTSGDGCLKSIDLVSKKIQTIACIGQGSIMDGITVLSEGIYLISDFNGRLFKVTKSGEKTELLNRTAPQQFCADFEYVKSQHLIIIPSLYDNRISAYSYKE